MSVTKNIDKFIKDYENNISFAELAQRVDGFQGDISILHSLGKNSRGEEKDVVVWSGVSQEAAEHIIKLINDKKIHYMPASPLTYLLDGMGLTIPQFDGIEEMESGVDYWLPVVINSGPMPEEYLQEGNE